MNRFVLHIVFLLIAVAPHSQNLIYNGSFENYYSCPVANDLNNGELEKVKDWWKPTGGTSDYFNRCNTDVVNIPNNFWGHQEPYEGNGYVGLVPIGWYSSGEITGYEYIQSELLDSLKPCYEYRFSMYVSLAEYSTHSIGRLGALFSKDTSFNSNFNTDAINIHPQVYYSNGQITDSVNWVKIEGNFVAQGNEHFITIGYFFPSITNDNLLIQINPWNPNEYAPYYYIDSIELIEIGEVSEIACHPPAMKLPNVITANNDGVNDLIDASLLLQIVSEIRILNRWGNTIAILNTDNPIWDGAGCTEGVYYYWFEFKEGNETKQQNGFIQLVRSKTFNH